MRARDEGRGVRWVSRWPWRGRPTMLAASAGCVLAVGLTAASGAPGPAAPLARAAAEAESQKEQGKEQGKVAAGDEEKVQAKADAADAQGIAELPRSEDDEIAERLKVTREQVRRLHTRRSLTDNALKKIPTELVNRLVRPLALPDLPRARVEFRRLQDQDRDGTIPENARYRALQQLAQIRARLADGATVAGVPTGRAVTPPRLYPNPAPAAAPGGPAPLAGLQNSVWQALGPGNIGGRIRSILVAPNPPAAGQPHAIFVGSVAGGIWRSVDNGASFAPVDDRMANLAVTCLAMVPNNPLVMFAGTGEGFANVDALRGAGIFRSVDGGTTWAQLPQTIGPNFHFVNRLAVSANGAVVLAGTNTGLFRSTNAGDAWTAVALPGTPAVLDVDFHPTDPNRCVASGRNGQAFVSANAGLNWTPAIGLPSTGGGFGGRVEVTYARANGNVVYASVDNNLGQIYRSNDGGQSYTLRFSSTANNNYLAEQGWYSHIIWAGDPANADHVIVGGIDLWRSTDGGQTIRDISTWWAPNQSSAHADHHAIVAHPRFGVAGDPNARTVYFGNDGGLFRTRNVTTVGNNADVPRTFGWEELVNTLAVTQFYSVAGSPASTTLIAGAQDNGTLRFTPAGGSENWTETEGGDGGYCAADPIDGTTFYGEYVYGTVFRNGQGGVATGGNPALRYICGLTDFQNWTFKPAPFRIDDAMNQRANFIAPFVLDPNNRNRLLVGGMSLWRTTNARATMTAASGPTWRSIKAAIGSFPPEHAISAIGLARGTSTAATSLIYVGHNNGNLYKTTSGTAPTPTWTQVDGGTTPLPDRYVHRIVIDPTDVNRVYVTFGGYETGNVWRSDNGGSTWTNLGASLPAAPVRSLAIHPDQPNFLYIGTEVGIFASENRGATWSPSNEGPTNCSVDDLLFINNVLHAATHGRGLFRIKLPVSP